MPLADHLTALADYYETFQNDSNNSSFDFALLNPDSRQDVAQFNAELARYPRLSRTTEIAFLEGFGVSYNSQHPGGSVAWYGCLNMTCQQLIECVIVVGIGVAGGRSVAQRASHVIGGCMGRCVPKWARTMQQYVLLR